MTDSENKKINRWAKLPKPKIRTHLERLNKGRTVKERIQKAETQEEKKVIKIRSNLTQARKNLTRAERRLKKLGEETENKKVIESIPEELLQKEPEEIVEETDSGPEVIFKPNPGPQTDFLAATEEEVFTGGGKGGGKTYGLIADPLRYCGNPNHSGLYIRRTMPDLRDIIFHTKRIYPKAFPGAKFKSIESCWYFPSGARQEFGFAENLTDTLRYQGKAYNWIGFDELPQYPDDSIYLSIKSCARTIDPTLPVHIRGTGNSGGVGSKWVKEMFIEPSPPNTTFYVEVEFFDRRIQKKVKRKVSRRFIPSTVWDNPYLLHDDKYLSILASLPEVKRKQLLEGDWDVSEFSAFPEFRRDGVHVIDAFDIPREWSRFRAADWGYSSPFCCLWFAVSYDGQIYVYREYYGKGVIADDWARNVALLEHRELIMDGLIDGSTAIRRGERGPTIFETINGELRKHGRRPFRFADRSPDSRIAGKQEVHKRLALREYGAIDKDGKSIKEPGVKIFRNCVHLINTLASLTTDQKEPEKVDKKCEDHAYDAFRYGLSSRPISPDIIRDMNKFREQNQPKDVSYYFD